MKWLLHSATATVTRVELEITTSSHSNCVFIAIHGEIDVHTAPRLTRALADAMDNAPQPRVLVDMAAVEFCDSTGVNALLTGMRQARRQGGDVELVAPCSTVRKVLAITGLDTVFAIHAESGAVHAVATTPGAQ